MAIEAVISLRDDAIASVGRERIRLLQAVAREGSITAAARAVGLTYKAAWDALDATQNLFGCALLEKRQGGNSGGGSQLTEAGVQVIAAFSRLEAEMARVLRTLEPSLRGSGVSPRDLMSGYFMKTSARNVLRGKIASISQDVLQAEIALTVSTHATIYAQITMQSLRELGLVEGRDALVLIKAPFVMLAGGTTPPQLSARNCLQGKVLRSETTPVSAEVVLDIGDGKTIAASLSRAGWQSLRLAKGAAAFAVFDAAHVIVAID